MRKRIPLKQQHSKHEHRKPREPIPQGKVLSPNVQQRDRDCRGKEQHGAQPAEARVKLRLRRIDREAAAGEQEHRKRFSQWLDYVALAVTNIRSVLAGDVIISGEAAQYLDDDDMAGLRERVVEHTPFGTTDFTLRKGMALDHQDIIGAALRFVEPYVRDLCDM